MTISNPSLGLKFLGNDLERTHSTSQTVTSSDIAFHSIAFKYQLLSGLKPSSNQVTLQIKRECSSIEDIIATNGDIQATLYDGTDILFTGYLSTNFSYSVTDSGEKALNITLEDTGTRLLGKNFIKTGYHLFNCSVYNALCAVCEAAGVTVSSSCTRITDTVTKVVEAGTTCKDILTQMLYEVGYVYYFDSLGELKVFKIDCSSTDNIPVLDKDELYVVSNKAITLSKKIRQYKSAKVIFKTHETADNYLIYRNTTDQSSDHPYCHLELPGGNWFDGTEVYTQSAWREMELDSFRVPALIEACNAESETDKVGSNKIVSISNVTKQFEKTGNITASIEAAGGPYIKITVHNTDSSAQYVNRLDAYASIIYEKDTGIVRTAQTPVTDDVSDNLLEEECSYIHTKELAQKHANLLGQYHKYCNAQYTFFSKEDLDLGSVIRIHDNIFTGLKVNVMLTEKTVSDDTDVIRYSAVGISAFDLTEDVWHQYSFNGKVKTAGTEGPEGKSAYEIAVEHGYEGTEEEWLESLKGEPGEDGQPGSPGAPGPAGPSGATATPYYQYALKKTGVTPSSSDFQNTIPTPWYYGQVYWLRVRYVWSDGRTDTYSDPWLDDNTNNALILSCKFEISADATNYVIDRRSGDSQNITFTAQQNGYNLVSFSWVVTDESDVKTGSQISVPIAKSTAPSSFTAVCTMTYLFGETQRTLERTITISSVDVTEYNYCFGLVTQEPSTAIEGDCYVIEDDGDYIPYVYQSGEWVEITDFSRLSVQASQIRDAILSNGINVPRTSTALYAYFMNLSAQNANIDFVSTSDITLKTSGKIHSDGYVQGTVKKLIDGELDPETTKKGFYQDYDGNAEFFKTDIFQANINEGVLNNVTVNGKLNSSTLVTQLEDEIGNSYRNKDITSGKKFWCESDIVSLIAAAVPHNSVVNCVGYFADTSFVNAIYVDDNTSSISLGKQTAWMAPVDARITPSGGTNLYVNGTKTFPVAVQRGKGAFVLDYLGTGGPISGYSSGHQCITAYAGGKYYLIFPEYLDILSSTDGKTWTVVKADITEMKTSTTSNWEKKFIGGNNRLLYLSYSGELFVSTNGGTSWSKSSNFSSLVWGGSATGKGCTLNFCNNKFYALVEGSSYVYESTDGLTWSQSFSSPYTAAYAMVYYNGKYTLFSFNKYTGYNAILAISSTDLVNWTAVTTDADMLQLTDVCVTNDGTYVMVGYSNSSTAGIAFSKDLTHWSPVQNPAGTFYMPSLCTNGTDVVCSNSYNAAIVSAKYTFGGNLSYKLNYQLGLHFLNPNTGAVFASPVNSWRNDTSFFTYNGTRLYYNTPTSVETTQKAYVYSGMQKLVSSTWVDISSGGAFTFSSITFRYQLVGQSERTVSSIQSITWTADQLTVIGSNTTVTLGASSLLASLTLTFVPVSRSCGNYTKSIFPMEGSYDIGAADNRFEDIYGENLYGQLHGNVQGNVTGNVTGDVTGNVNAAGTTKKVYGAVWN